MSVSTEVHLTNGGYGGDFVLTAQGDVQLVSDSNASTVATTERLLRLLLTNPRLFGSSGQPIGRPDDRFNPTYGSGVKALVGEPITQQLLFGIRTRILSALSQDPAVAANPAPTVNVTDQGGGFILITGDQSGNMCYTTTGQPITVPPQQIQILGTFNG